MNISVPKERRPFEFRVGLPPAGVGMFTRHGHTVFVERDAGKGAGFEDQEYINAGAQIAYSLEETLGRADLVLKFARPDHENSVIYWILIVRFDIYWKINAFSF